MQIRSAPNSRPKASSLKTSPTAPPSGGERETTDYSLSAPGGGEGRGEVGDSRALADIHLTLPALARRAPSPPKRAERKVVRPLAMAGTDRTRAGVLGGPAIILVEPQLGENIGTAARAVMNCGLDDMRLVRPRDGSRFVSG